MVDRRRFLKDSVLTTGALLSAGMLRASAKEKGSELLKEYTILAERLRKLLI